ncbi:uncharacterized mitochondrial protein AtMg00810-like [Lathyrus oleraceus]|uniref:uncharacterized mitochondrial protein AtMg00810-like n=1 Tax=Pisum sativum TaxID=3888 RepID=UPI0021D2DEC0|nr:uncharacterized mitochondrial protein AtMg00810-like [Pisum sativum]
MTQPPGFISSDASLCGPSLVIFNNKDCCIYMLIYVDDTILTSSPPIMIQQLISKLDSVFSLKQLGDLDYFLGIEVKRTFSGNLLLSQGKYVRDLLQRAKKDGCKSITTPLPAVVKLSNVGTDFFEDPTL